MKILILKNSLLVVFAKVLQYEMPLAQGRLRNRFLKLVSEKGAELDKNRVDICIKYAEKDADGNLVMVENQYIFPTGEVKVYQELADLFNEDCKIDFPLSTISDIGGLKHLIDLSTVNLSPLETEQVEAILEALSTIQDTPPEPTLPEVEGKVA